MHSAKRARVTPPVAAVAVAGAGAGSTTTTERKPTKTELMLMKAESRNAVALSAASATATAGTETKGSSGKEAKRATSINRGCALIKAMPRVILQLTGTFLLDREWVCFRRTCKEACDSLSSGFTMSPVVLACRNSAPLVQRLAGLHDNSPCTKLCVDWSRTNPHFFRINQDDDDLKGNRPACAPLRIGTLSFCSSVSPCELRPPSDESNLVESDWLATFRPNDTVFGRRVAPLSWRWVPSATSQHCRIRQIDHLICRHTRANFAGGIPYWLTLHCTAKAITCDEKLLTLITGCMSGIASKEITKSTGSCLAALAPADDPEKQKPVPTVLAQSSLLSTCKSLTVTDTRFEGLVETHMYQSLGDWFTAFEWCLDEFSVRFNAFASAVATSFTMAELCRIPAKKVCLRFDVGGDIPFDSLIPVLLHTEQTGGLVWPQLRKLDFTGRIAGVFLLHPQTLSGLVELRMRGPNMGWEVPGGTERLITCWSALANLEVLEMHFRDIIDCVRRYLNADNCPRLRVLVIGGRPRTGMETSVNWPSTVDCTIAGQKINEFVRNGALEQLELRYGCVEIKTHELRRRCFEEALFPNNWWNEPHKLQKLAIGATTKLPLHRFECIKDLTLVIDNN